MYKRYLLGTPEHEATRLSGVASFCAFCAVVVWLLPYGIEAVAGHPPEVFFIPPIWRAEIMCASTSEPSDREYTYVMDGGDCIKKCKTPGCPVEGDITPKNPPEIAAANMRAARSGLDIADIYELVLMGLRYGTPVASIISLGVMRLGVVYRPAWAWLCVPCGVAAAAAAFEPVLVPAALAAWVVAYAVDMWSTSRFGERDVQRFEINPILRSLLWRFGMRPAFILHTILYAALLGGLSALMAMAGPLPWEQVTGMLAFALAGAHVWAAASNIREYGYGRLA